MTYIFKTTTTMKPYNNKNWWIDSDIISEKRIEADKLKEALSLYRSEVKEKHYITITNHAMRNKSPMYIDTPDGEKQVGYVITGKADFQTNDYRWSAQYIELWVTILTVTDTNFEGV